MSIVRTHESGSTALKLDEIVKKASRDLASQKEAFVIQEVSKSPLFQLFVRLHFEIREKSKPEVKLDGGRMSVTQEIEVRRSLNLLKALKFLLLYPLYFFIWRVKPVKAEAKKA